jgi:hypothetical protein
MMIVVMVGVLLLFRRSNGITVFVIGMTSVRNWFHVALLVGGKQHQDHKTDREKERKSRQPLSPDPPGQPLLRLSG